jgi:aromatic-L-amino-acid/L-tryptophan decarboxylase
VDHMMDFRSRPVWQLVSPRAEALLRRDLPRAGESLSRVVDDFFEDILPYPTGNTHPRFWGWVGGAGTPGGVIAETLTAVMNALQGNFNDAAARVEDLVNEWMRQLVGLPEGSSGIMTSGGSVANLIGLATARDARAGYDTVVKGVDTGAGKLVFYASTEVHSSVIKAAQILGLGRDAAHLIPVNDAWEIEVRALVDRIKADRLAGLRPFAIIGNAGSVNTGAIDDLNALAEISQNEGLWFHVDGAFGALAVLSQKLRHKVAGMERADSVAFDFHKWMSVQYDAGCVLIRDAQAHRRSFSVSAEYLAPLTRGTAARSDRADKKGPQLSRSFRALKVWMTIREHGIDKFGRLIEQNVAGAQYLSRLIEEADDFELLAPVPLNVVTFRYNPGDLSNDELNDLNRELLMQVQESGIAVPSSTVLNGRFTLRVANVNHRTILSDFDLLLASLRRLGERETSTLS